MADLQRPRLLGVSNFCTVENDHGQRVSFPKYRYTPLQRGRTIRLLELQAQAQSSVSQMNEFSLIEYDLESTNLSSLDVSESPFVAISYCWGAPNFDAPLLVVNDHGHRSILPVTTSVWEAVHHTLPYVILHRKLLWIDQICIDQENKSEKAVQVKLMVDVYRRCHHCMIWLGPADASTHAAYSLFRRLEEVIGVDCPIPVSHREVADLSHAKIRAQLSSNYGKDLLPPPTDPGWVGVAKLLQRGWFERLWTFQEAVLCYKGDTSVRCGQHSISVITFMRVSMFMGHEHVFEGIDFTNGRATLAQISNFRWNVEHGNVTPLIWLLQTTGLRQCTDPRDRIYALLGVRKEDGPEWSIEVNYETSPEKLYTEVARKIIQSQAALRICAEAPERTEGSELSSLPSWVPDWTRKPLATVFELLDPSASYFKASNGRVHVDRVLDSQILVAKGMRVDSMVESIDTAVPGSVTETERRKALVEDVLPLLWMTLQSKAPTREDASLAHTIINTITVGGYTRTMNLGKSGLQHDAWSEAVCAHMLFSILGIERHATVQPLNIGVDQWLHALTRQALFCTDRQFAVLQNNLLGLVPKGARNTDSVVILHGSSLPFVLRDAGNGCFEKIGACYVDGIMHGEAVKWDLGNEIRIC